jgi:hypothetical protein
MKRHFESSQQIFGPRLLGKTRLRACLLSLVTLLMTASLAQAGRPGGVAVLLPFFIPVQAPQPYLPMTTPFDMVGYIQTATVDTPADYFSAGWLEVNGLKIRVPRNTIFQMPATSMTWADMFMNAPAAYKALGQSGLALSDGSATVAKPLTSYEVHVVGNRIVNPSATRDEYVAGLIYISQQSLNIGVGIINAFDYTACIAGTPCMPDIWVGSSLTAKTGARLRINTPNGRYGGVDVNLTNGIADKRFTSDEDNPTVVARTGYPMCVPRFDPGTKLAPGANDSLCPQWNRPTDPFTGAHSVNYTFPAATAGVAGADGITHQIGFPTPAVRPDAFEQTPLELGDNVSYSGNLVQDKPCVAGAPMSSCQYISAHTVIAELGLFTAPSTWPVYTFMESLVMGVGGTPNPIFPQEAVEKIFANWMTTDFSQLVDIYSEDVDSTTGNMSHRFYGSSDPFGPPLGGLKGRARFRVTIGNFLPPTRNMAAASRSMTGGAPLDTILPTARLVANGLKAGYYTAPDFGFIFPENLILGSLQIPNTFQEFPFLVNGSGPYVPFGSAPNTLPVGTIGQLSPWPDVSAPPALLNSVGLTLLQPPVANAGPPQTVPSGSLVTLSAAASVDTNVPALPLVYTWQQLSGPVVIMQNFNTMISTQTFVAPILAPGAAPVVITVQLAVCNGFTCGGAVTVPITVTSSVNASAPTVSLTASKTLNIVPNTDTVTLTATATCGASACGPIVFKQTGGPVQTLTGAGLTRSFKMTALPAGTPTPAPLTFTASTTSGGSTSTSTVTLFAGPDTITVINVVYQLAHSKLQVSTESNAMPKGAAIVTVTPLVNKKVSGPSIVCIYDPVIDGYLILADIANPIPDSVHIVSNYGANLVAPVVRVR